MMKIEDISEEAILKNREDLLRYIEKSIKSYDLNLISENTGYVSIWKNRREDAYKSFLLLYKNRHYYDAMMLSGYILELSAVIYDIEINGDSAYQKHLTSFIISKVKHILRVESMNTDELQEDHKSMYDNLLRDLELNGYGLLKTQKNMQIVMETLKNPKKTCNEKLKILDNSFRQDNIGAIIEGFIKKIKLILEKRNDLILSGGEKLVKNAYITYCEQKHSSLNSYDLTDEYYKQTSLYLAFTVRFFSENDYIPADA